MQARVKLSSTMLLQEGRRRRKAWAFGEVSSCVGRSCKLDGCLQWFRFVGSMVGGLVLAWSQREALAAKICGALIRRPAVKSRQSTCCKAALMLIGEGWMDGGVLRGIK